MVMRCLLIVGLGNDISTISQLQLLSKTSFVSLSVPRHVGKTVTFWMKTSIICHMHEVHSRVIRARVSLPCMHFMLQEYPKINSQQGPLAIYSRVVKQAF